MNELARVVLVEDDDVDIMAMTRALRASGLLYSLTVVRDGVEALEWLRKEHPKPHIVFLDLNMPRMGGLEVLEALQRYGPALPNVIVLATSDAVVDREAALARGATDYIVKSDYMGDFRAFSEMVSGHVVRASSSSSRLASHALHESGCGLRTKALNPRASAAK